MELKDIYTEFVKELLIVVTLYIPITITEGVYSFTDWGLISRLIFTLLFTYFNVLLYDFQLSEGFVLHKRVKKALKSLKQSIKEDFNKLRRWH